MSFTELKRTILQLTPRQRREVFDLLSSVSATTHRANKPSLVAKRSDRAELRRLKRVLPGIEEFVVPCDK